MSVIDGEHDLPLVCIQCRTVCALLYSLYSFINY